MKFYVGTSGFGYKAWNGKFYPKDLPATQMLRHYAERFNAVEINNSFYRMPDPAVLQTWANDVPDEFKFSIKSPRAITHTHRLRNASDAVERFVTVASTLQGRLAPLLFQLPPNFKKDTPRLETFLALLPKAFRVAFEFRHQSWFEDDVFQLLTRRRAALCVAQDDNDLKVPLVSTTDWGYLRLRRLDYGDAELKSWAKDITAQPWKDAFVFFKHEDKAIGPALASKFMTFI